MPNAAALAAEYVPRPQRPLRRHARDRVRAARRRRSPDSLAIAVLPAVGWRGMFVIGGIVPIVAAARPDASCCPSRRAFSRGTRAAGRSWRGCFGAWVTRSIPDASFTDVAESAVKPGALEHHLPSDLRLDTFALWAAFFSCLLSVYLGFSWLPSMLTGAGLSPAVASTGMTVFNLGGVVGAIAAGTMIARFGSSARC